MILIPRGIYLLQPIQLSYSNIHIHFEDGATFQSINDDEEYILRPKDFDVQHDIQRNVRSTSDYDTIMNHNQQRYYWPITPALVTYGGGREDGRRMRYEAFFSITSVSNVTISGSYGGTTTDSDTTTTTATMNGGGPLWWKLYNDHSLHFTRPRLLEIRHSTNIEIYNITLVESPFWTFHIYNTSYINIHNIYIHNEMYGRVNNTDYSSSNVDGIDVNSCHDVTIQNSTIITHDDAIVIKSGLDLAGIRASIPSYNIMVHNVIVKSPKGAGLGIGSEVSGGIYNVTFSNVTVFGSKFGIRVKTSHGRGNRVSDISFDHINIMQVDNTQYGPNSIITISMFGGNRPHLLRGYHWNDITTIENMLFDHITIYPSNTNIKNLGNNNDNVPTTTIATTTTTMTNIAGIYVLGDTNLRQYWSLPFTTSKTKTSPSYNEYICNITFQNIINLVTTTIQNKPAINDMTTRNDDIVSSLKQDGLVDPTTTTTTTKLSLDKQAQVEQQEEQQLEQKIPLVHFDCSNAVNVQFNQQNMICENKPYIMLSYDFDQIGHAIHKLFH
jgi:polygalacturonase